MQLQGKVAIITGAGSGIGLATAKRFLAAGASVVLSDIKPGEAMKVVQDNPDKALWQKCNVAKVKEVDRLIKAAVDKWGKLDIMFNNAGIGSMGSVQEADDKAWEQTLTVNLSGAFYGIRAAARVMIEQGTGGSIISTSSILGQVGLPGAVAYCASKGGINQLTRAAAMDLASYKIRVNAIAPGFIATNMTKGVLEDKGFKQMVEANTPMGHIGKPDDIAAAALYLASDDSNYVTGDILYVDGGWRAH
ncbi:MAG: SDR family NAD(P)-dependent oxidoreductase [Candidatus Komeilibacteria bacterium]